MSFTQRLRCSLYAFLFSSELQWRNLFLSVDLVSISLLIYFFIHYFFINSLFHYFFILWHPLHLSPGITSYDKTFYLDSKISEFKNQKDYSKRFLPSTVIATKLSQMLSPVHYSLPPLLCTMYFFSSFFSLLSSFFSLLFLFATFFQR